MAIPGNSKVSNATAAPAVALTLALILTLALAGCSAGPAPAPSGQTTGSAPGSSISPSGTAGPAPSASSADGALQPFDQAALEQTFSEAARELRVPGSVMLLRTPGGNLTRTYGVRSLGGSDQVTPEDHVRIGSVTKTWTGTVILQLVQEGRISSTTPSRTTAPMCRTAPTSPSNSC